MSRGADHEALGFVGLGLMGLPMTRRLLAAGRRVTVWNRSPSKRDLAVAEGAIGAESAAAVAAASDIVFLNLTDTAAVDAVAFGPGGLAQVPGQGKLVVDFSSIRPDATLDIAARLEAANGMRWVDAPVSGGTKGAAEGSLAIMAGGAAGDIERARPHVMTMAARLTHMGPLGAGQATKLCNQMIVGCAMAVLAEATRLAANSGIDPARLPEALAGGFADSKPLQLFVPRMAAALHDPPLGHAYTILKDLDTALDVARETGTPAPMTALASQLFRTLIAGRGGRRARDLHARGRGVRSALKRTLARFLPHSGEGGPKGRMGGGQAAPVRFIRDAPHSQPLPARGRGARLRFPR